MVVSFFDRQLQQGGEGHVAEYQQRDIDIAANLKTTNGIGGINKKDECTCICSVPLLSIACKYI